MEEEAKLENGSTNENQVRSAGLAISMLIPGIVAVFISTSILSPKFWLSKCLLEILSL